MAMIIITTILIKELEEVFDRLYKDLPKQESDKKEDDEECKECLVCYGDWDSDTVRTRFKKCSVSSLKLIFPQVL